MKNLIVYGGGAFGSLIANLISYHSNLNIAAYGDDDLKKICQHETALVKKIITFILPKNKQKKYF